ncbi:MAG: HrgA protein [Mesorhizobium sp.]|uniref:HrgA protein n=1 Tax=Mesorhizobium sp. TaxID=1871066 RepID=UPI0011F7DE34|nr:HrgA protein [Mesorhizobium sp.]TIP06450.1 MAG: HrgA protein [Mesorhizobium sp.]
MTLELRKRVFELLASRPDERFKARDIAKWICEQYPLEVAEKLEASASLTNQTQLLNQLVAEIGANRPGWEQRYPELRTTEGVRPRLYYWTAKSEEAEVQEAEQVGKASQSDIEEPRIREHDLYPMLVDFLLSEQGIRAERIDERRSSNSSGSGGNKWLFPDVVGIEDLTAGLNPEVVSAIRESRDQRLRLWSFEVKMLVNRSNARETYFQAVSNSSWANLGYLVAAEIEGVNTLKELRILYAMHGIGLIKLDVSNPAESQILIPARERLDLEWAMCSRLADENKDFKSFMKRVRQFFQTGDL